MIRHTCAPLLQLANPVDLSWRVHENGARIATYTDIPDDEDCDDNDTDDDVYDDLFKDPKVAIPY